MINLLTGLDKNTEVVVQGITGKEGQRVTEFMLKAGVKVVGGVRPGKGGEEVAGVAVYNTVAEALAAHPKVMVSCVYVPPQFVLAASREALEAGIKFLHVIGEGVPVADTAILLAEARDKGAVVLGPASLGLIKPNEFKLGSIGGDDNSSFMRGQVGVISRSGGMSSELSYVLTQAGIGQSMVVHVGGDYLVGLTPSEAMEYFEHDSETKVVFLVGEVGGSYELEVAEMMKRKEFTKPLVVFLAGQFVESLPQGVPLGHAGAIIGGKSETRAGKIAVLTKVGATIVDKPDEIVSTMKRWL